jgi:hypothetical protein
MNNLTLYRQSLHTGRVNRWRTFFDDRKRMFAKRNMAVRAGWTVLQFLLMGCVGILLYCDYVMDRFRDFTFDAGCMEFEIKMRGLERAEAMEFLHERQIQLKEYVYRNIVKGRQRAKAERAFDFLLFKYDVPDEKRSTPATLRQNVPETRPWIETVWKHLIDRRCVVEPDKANIILLLTGTLPAAKIVWKKGLGKLIRFVEEGIDARKITVPPHTGKNDFVTKYVIDNFLPDPNVPNQKNDSYTDERIRTAKRLNTEQDYGKRILIKEYFVFD